jgi:DNA repair protein RadC
MDIAACSDAARDAIIGRPTNTGEGDLSAVFLDAAARVLMTVEVGEGTRHVDELFLRHLITIVDDLRLDAVVFIVCRSAGRPHRVDRLLWRELDQRLSTAETRLVDLIVIGNDRFWSASTGRYRTMEPNAVFSAQHRGDPLAGGSPTTPVRP